MDVSFTMFQTKRYWCVGSRGKNACGYTFFVKTQWKAYSREDMEYIASVDLHNKGLQELHFVPIEWNKMNKFFKEKKERIKERNKLLKKDKKQKFCMTSR